MTVSEVARELGISTVTIYRWIQREPMLHRVLQLKKQKKTITLTPEEVDVIRRVTGVQQPEQTTSESTAEPEAETPLVDHLKQTVTHLQETVTHLLQQQEDKDRRHDTILMTLSRQIADQAAQIQTQSLQLEDLRQKVSPPPAPRKSTVVPIRPEVPAEPHPMASWTPLQLLAIKFFQPWKLRRDYREKKAA